MQMQVKKIAYELKPKHTDQKSFYKKAMVEIKGNESRLMSYGTHAASVFSGIKQEDDRAEVYNLQSATTLKHVKEFLKQFRFKAETKKQIEEDYFK